MVRNYQTCFEILILMYCVFRKGTAEADLVTARQANKICADVVINFYEQRLSYRHTAVSERNQARMESSSQKNGDDIPSLFDTLTEKEPIEKETPAEKKVTDKGETEKETEVEKTDEQMEIEPASSAKTSNGVESSETEPVTTEVSEITNELEN